MKGTPTRVENEEFQLIRSLILKIAHAKPGKKRRWKVLREKHRSLFDQIVESELFDYLLEEEDVEFEPMDELGPSELEDWSDGQ